MKNNKTLNRIPKVRQKSNDWGSSMTAPITFRNRPITRYLSHHSLPQYTVIKKQNWRIYYVTPHRPINCSSISSL